MELRLSVLLSACLLLALVGPAGARKGRCPRKQSCDQCIRAGPECAWCNHPDITGPRCNTEERLVQAGCVRDLYNPRGGLLSVTNESRWEARTRADQAVQATVVRLTLRPGVVQSALLTLPRDRQTTREVTLESSPTPQHLNITFNHTGNPWVIQVNVEATHCPPENGSWAVTITPKGFAQLLELQITSECACQCTQRPPAPSPSCGGRGSLECGRCACDAPYAGGRCQRRRWAPGPTTHRGDGRCRQSPDALEECSGRGTCEEGFCICRERTDPSQRYTGHYCECSNFNCPHADGRMCGGQGRCACGRCVCDEGWTHEACDCSTDAGPCTGPDRNICSNRGTCRCGRCVCEEPFQGVRCENSPFTG
ncbi:integrin beta-1-like isoform X1 [Gadus chalcogrammus]|uniref:integrin beta-1-like isoform X1 n=1 Tax=Gadus chalcogrammus TaxID=1042646 RepID=UPI0024C46575|nr:integrin beta-1-like isoform X1 [Gadus chalcogrammus]